MPTVDTARPQDKPRWQPALPWLLLAAALVAAYALHFHEMWQRWFPGWKRTQWSLYDRVMQGESYYTHGPLVPVVSVIMAVLLIRHTRIPVKGRPVLGGLLLAGSLLFHLAACLARVNFASGFSLMGVLAGLVLMLWGTTALRRLWFPIAFLFFMVPLPEVSIARLNFSLKMLAADTGVRIANLLGIVAERSGNTVFLEGGKQLVIANVCNGLRTLISLVAFGALYAYVCKLRGVWRLGLFVMSVPVAVVSNSIRIITLIAVAHGWSVEAATGFFHDASGLMIYAVAFGLMFGLERLVLAARRWAGRPAAIVPLFHGIERDPDDAEQWPRLVRATATPAGWIAVGLVAATAFGALHLSRAVPPTWTGQVAAEAVPDELTIDGHRLHSYDMELDEQTLTILETRDYIYKRYVRAGTPPVDFCLIFSQDNRKGTHPPDLCLEGGGQDIIAKGDVVLEGVEGHGTIRCRELVVQHAGVRTYHLYTYRCGNRYTPSFWDQQITIFLNGLLNHNASGALIRVSTPVKPNVDEARRRTKALMSAAVPYLERALP